MAPKWISCCKVIKTHVPRKKTVIRPIPQHSACLRCIRKAYMVSNVVCTTPFIWKPEDLGPQTSQSRWRKLLWAGNLLLYSSHVIFSVVQYFRTSWMESSKAEPWEKVYSQFSAVLYIYGLLLHLAMYTARLSFLRMVRCIVAFFTLTKKGHFSQLALKTMDCIYYFAYTLPLIIGCACFFMSNLPDLWISAVYGARELGFVPRAVQAGLHCYFGLLLCDAGMVVTVSGVPVLFSVIDLLDEMSKKVGDIRKLEGRMVRASLDQLIHQYQGLRVLVAEYNVMHLIIVSSTQVCFISLATFGAYGMFRTRGILSILLMAVGCFCVFFVILSVKIMGEVNSRSQEFLQAMKRQLVLVRQKTSEIDATLASKELKSLPELKLKVGSAYHIDTPIVLTTLQIMFDNVVNFVVATE